MAALRFLRSAIRGAAPAEAAAEPRARRASGADWSLMGRLLLWATRNDRARP